MKSLRCIIPVLVFFLFVSSKIVSQEKYAIIVTGETAGEDVNFNGSWLINANPPITWDCFWNDTYLMWEMLVVDKGFSDENVYVLYYDGIDFNFDEQDERYTASHNEYVKVTDLEASKYNLEIILTGFADGSNGIPQLTEDDFLLVYTFGHGDYVFIDEVKHSLITLRDFQEDPNHQEWDEANSVADFELQLFLDDIICDKKVVIMQQCFSGGFVPFLENSNTVILTAANADMGARRTDELYFDSIDYPGDEDPGNSYSTDENEQYVSEGHEFGHGEFNLHLLNAFRGVTPNEEVDEYIIEDYINVPLSDADLNEDNVISIYECYEWIKLYNSRQRWWDPGWGGYDDPQYPEEQDGNVTSLEYPTLIFEDIGPIGGVSVEHRGIIGITKDVHINSTNELTFLNDADVYLLNDAKLIVDAGATLILEDDVSIVATNENNKIEVDGYLLVGDNVSFSSEDEHPFEIQLRNTSLQPTFNNSTFQNCEIHNYTDELNIYSSIFNNCDMVYSYRGNINIENSSFSNTGVYLETAEGDTDTVWVTNCNFTTSQLLLGISLWNYNQFTIENNTINSYYDGIQVMQTGESLPNNKNITGNTILNCSNAGIVTFNSAATIIENYIHNNQDGIRLLNNSNVSVYGNPGALYKEEINRITDNERYELYASSGSFPWYFRYNAIEDADNSGNPVDPHIYDEPSGGLPALDVSYNCWDEHFDATTDLYPLGYIHLPEWCPPGVEHKTSNLALQEFQNGIEYFEDEEYANAKTTFESIIEQYPQTQFACAAMKELYTLKKFGENDYNVLKQYYQTNDSIQTDTILTKLALFLANKCEIELENWQTAIDHFEDIIENPESTEDSIFAIIDLGYTYFLMENSDKKSMAYGTMYEHIPISIESFIEKRDQLLALLPLVNSCQEFENELSILKSAELIQNIPNPFTNSTTVYFKLKEPGDVVIKVFDNVGAEVKRINNAPQNEGINKVDLDMSGLPPVIYYCSLFINGDRADAKKMIVQ